MARKGLSRGRGPRVTDDELGKMVSLYLEGKSFKAIATEVGRHWQTVRKYTVKALQEREGRELRREALKGALIDHFKDLVSALGSLDELLVMPAPLKRLELPDGWRSPVPERRNRLLLQALRESHARESPLWSWWDGWNQTREAYEGALSLLHQRVTGELTRLQESHPGVSFDKELTEVLFYRGSSLAQGSSLYDPSMLQQVRPPSDQEGKTDGEELWLGRSTRLVSGLGIDSLRQEMSKLMKDMAEWGETEALARLYRQMAETKGKIEEEVTVLSLRRAFPGHCRLCPV